MNTENEIQSAIASARAEVALAEAEAIVAREAAQAKEARLAQAKRDLGVLSAGPGGARLLAQWATVLGDAGFEYKRTVESPPPVGRGGLVKAAMHYEVKYTGGRYLRAELRWVTHGPDPELDLRLFAHAYPHVDVVMPLDLAAEADMKVVWETTNALLSKLDAFAREAELRARDVRGTAHLFSTWRQQRYEALYPGDYPTCADPQVTTREAVDERE